MFFVDKRHWPEFGIIATFFVDKRHWPEFGMNELINSLVRGSVRNRHGGKLCIRELRILLVYIFIFCVSYLF